MMGFANAKLEQRRLKATIFLIRLKGQNPVAFENRTVLGV